MTTHDRVNGPVRINPFTLVKLPRETVERFLLFATTPGELASELAETGLAILVGAEINAESERQAAAMAATRVPGPAPVR